MVYPNNALRTFYRFEHSAIPAIEAGMIVHSREYEGNLVRLAVSGPASLVGRLRQFRQRDE